MAPKRKYAEDSSHWELAKAKEKAFREMGASASNEGLFVQPKRTKKKVNADAEKTGRVPKPFQKGKTTRKRIAGK